MTGRRIISALFAMLLFCAAEGFAAGGENLAEKVGKWTFSMNEPGPDVKKLSSNRLKNIRGNLQEIARLITAAPAMSPPKGFEARFWGSISGRDRYHVCSGKSCPPSRPTAVLALMLGRYEENDGRTRAAFNKPATMDIAVNNLGLVFSHLPVLYQDGDGYLFPEPRRDGERLGFPAYLNNGHAVTVLSRSSVPLWLPVSRERYLQAAIDALGKELGIPAVEVKPASKKAKVDETPVPKGNPIILEEGKSWVDPATEKERLERSRSLTDEIKLSADELTEKRERLLAELAALPPEQRLLPARIAAAGPAAGGKPALLPPESSDGVAVVTPNFDFFNRKLPPDAPQLITIQWKFAGTPPAFDPETKGIAENLNNLKLLELYRSVEWQKLSGKLPAR